MKRLSLENVVEDILSQANTASQKIIKEAEEEAEKILSKTYIDSEKQVETFERQTEKTVDERKNSELLSARIEQKRMVLAAKKMAGEKISDEIKRKLSQLDAKERESIIKILVDKAKKELNDSKYIYSNAADKVIAGKMGLEFAGTIDCVGGVIVESSDKKVRINSTFDRLFEDFKEKLNEEIAKVFY